MNAQPGNPPTRLLDALDDLAEQPATHAFIAGMRAGLTLADLDHND